jgi:outer membrane receptor protein involved in Fe transport
MSWMRVITLLVACMLAASAADALPLSGRVVFADGSPAQGATITIAALSDTAISAADGTFTMDLPAGEYELAIRLPGFVVWYGLVSVGVDQQTPVLVTLQAASDPAVVVVLGKGRAAEPAAPVSVVGARDLELAVSPALDDVLRETPGFSLFRRTSSRTANPTTQGATLRGLAASGASRAVVLADGLTLNDTFGGWVYWNRVPQASIERVDVVRGAASDEYGADALGGIVEVRTLSPEGGRPSVRAMIDGDTLATARTSLFGGVRSGIWTVSGAGEASRTDGAYVVDEDTRGAIDTRAGVDYLTGQLTAGAAVGSWRLLGRARASGESRENGTVLQANDTSHRQLSADVSGALGRGYFEASAAGGDQTYHQTFSAIAPDRNTETLTSRQTVPTTAAYAAVDYRLPIGTSDLLAGVDVREVWATNVDVGYLPSGGVRSTTSSPGYDRATGVYAQFRAPIGERWSVIAGVRNDWWNRTQGGDAVSVASPRLVASYRISDRVVARASVARAFRAPTINERIRPFRAGNILTLANAGLDPERVTLVEGSVHVTAGTLTLQGAVFTSDVEDAVTNVTVSSTPQLITRQRQNAAGVRATGAEAEGEWHLRAPLWLTGSVALTDSTYRDTPGLSGNDVPQVPRWQSTIGLRWLMPSKVVLQGTVRGIGAQFEDDRNTLVLRSTALVDLAASRPISRRTSLFASAENLFNVDYDTGRTPTRTVGTPFTFRVAVRYSY